MTIPPLYPTGKRRCDGGHDSADRRCLMSVKDDASSSRLCPMHLLPIPMSRRAISIGGCTRRMLTMRARVYDGSRMDTRTRTRSIPSAPACPVRQIDYHHTSSPSKERARIKLQQCQLAYCYPCWCANKIHPAAHIMMMRYMMHYISGLRHKTLQQGL